MADASAKFTKKWTGWSWNKEMVDALHVWEGRNLGLVSSRRWSGKNLSLEWFRAIQKGKARRKFVEHGGENVEYLVLQRIWGYKEKIFDKRRNNQTDQMIRNLLTHANPGWREQGSTSVRIPDPKNQDKMKRRRAGVVHTNWNNLLMKWSGCEMWWECSEDWKSYVKMAEELCKRILKKDEDCKESVFPLAI